MGRACPHLKLHTMSMFGFPGLCLLLLSAVLLMVYHEGVQALLKDWLSNTASFGLVILALSVLMARDGVKRLYRGRREPRPALFPGIIILLAGSFIYLTGSVAGILLFQQFALLVSLTGLAWLVLGMQFMAVLWIPFGYLLFSLPLPDELLLHFSPQLQSAAAWTAATVLELTGMPVTRDGQILTLPHITLEVARECNGINHIIALTSLAIPAMFFSRASVFRKLCVAVLSFVLGVVLNGVRIAMIGWWSVSHKELHGPMSTLLVSFIFFVGILLLYLPLYLFPRTEGEEGAGSSSKSSARVPAAPSRLAISAGAAALCLALTMAALHWYRPAPVQFPEDRVSLLRTIGGWSGSDVDKVLNRLDQYNPDFVIRRQYRDSVGRPGVAIYIGYFALQRQGHEVVSYYTDRYHHSSRVMSLVGVMKVNWCRLEGKTSFEEAYFWYEIDNQALLGRLSAKSATVMQWLTERRTNGAFVAIVPEPSGRTGDMTPEQKRFVRAAIPLVRECLKF